MPRADLLLVSLGTTLGWRRADRLFLEQLERAGARTEAVSVSFGLAARLRRGYPVNDLVEMHAARRALLTALARHEPRAIVISSTTAAMALPRIPMPYAVRLDAPARMNRPGARNAVLHALERRGLGRARLTLAARAGLRRTSCRPDPRRRWWSRRLSSPRGRCDDERERVAVAYVPDPKAKGLDVLAAGWAAAALSDARLEVYGLDPEWARAHLRRAGVPEPPGLELRGTVPAGEFRARIRAARVYAAGARWEDFGQAPLEALADGALLATVPSGGPFEALRLVRELGEPGLIASALDGAGARERHQGGLRAARGARARLPRRGARAACARSARRRSRRPSSERCLPRLARLGACDRSQHGALPGLGIGARRMALRDRAAARREPLAQLRRRARAGAAPSTSSARFSGSTSSAFSPSTATSPAAPARRLQRSGRPAAAPSRIVTPKGS